MNSRDRLAVTIHIRKYTEYVRPSVVDEVQYRSKIEVQTLSLAPRSLSQTDAANNEANHGLPTNTTTSTPIIDLVLSFNTQQFNNARNQTR